MRGKVVKSEVRRRRLSGHRGTGEKRVGNFPHVVYEYSIDGRVMRGDRINVTPPVPDVEIEQTLDRYPVGTEVRVYCNPRDMAESVLERDWPRGLGLAVIALIGCIAAVAYGVPWLLTLAESELAPRLPRPDRAWIVVLSGAATVFVLWLWAALRVEQTQALGWPTVKGRIVTSCIEAFFLPRRGSGQVRQVSFRPMVVYRYEVHERRYEADRVTLGGRGTGVVRFRNRDPDVAIVDRTGGRADAYAPPRWMTELVTCYPVDSEVDVFHDPKQPANAVLDPMVSGTQWLLLFIVLGLIALATWAAFG